MHDVGGHVAAERIGDVVLEGGDRALTVDDSLADDAEEGNHGEAAVLDLLHSHRVGVHAHGIKGEVLVDAGLAGREPAADALELEDAHDGELDGEEGRDGEVVVGGASLVPGALSSSHEKGREGEKQKKKEEQEEEEEGEECRVSVLRFAIGDFAQFLRGGSVFSVNAYPYIAKCRYIRYCSDERGGVSPDFFSRRSRRCDGSGRDDR